MKIDLDLSEIYSDEDGHKLQQSFVDDVIKVLSRNIEQNLAKEISSKIDLVITELVREAVKTKLEFLLYDLMDHEFRPTTDWGAKDKPVTVRNKIIEHLHAQIEYKKSSDYYDRDKETIIAKVLKDVITSHTKPLVDDLRNTINYEFKKECINAAREKLLDITKK